MSLSITTFMKNDNIFVKSLRCDTKTRMILEAYGIYDGAELHIFYRDRNNMILKIGETKLAISKEAASSILISEKTYK